MAKAATKKAQAKSSKSSSPKMDDMRTRTDDQLSEQLPRRELRKGREPHRRGERGVEEVDGGQVRSARSQPGGDEAQVVVLHEDDRAVGRGLGRRVGERMVDRAVGVPEGGEPLPGHRVPGELRLGTAEVAESGDAPVIAGTGTYDTRHSVHLTERATALLNLGTTNGQLGRYDTAAEHFEQALVLFRQTGDPAGQAQAADVLGEQRPDVALEARRAGHLRRGRLLGGNLTVLTAILGSPYVPDWEDAILFCEDVGEDLYRVDRMLAHLRLIGALRRLSGVLIGRFTKLNRSGADGALGYDEVLADYFRPLGVPVAYGFPVGHIDAQWTLPLGVRVRLDAGAGEVEVLEPAVS